MFWPDYPDGCPPQQEQMYAFKIFALAEAIHAGFRYVLWMDSAFQPIRSIAPLWAAIEQDGWYVPPQLKERLSRWCSDEALAKFGIDRQTAAEILLVYSGLVGLDMQSETGRAIWDGWESLYSAGAFNGPHRNVPGQPMEPWGQKWAGHCCDDPEVQGHRHDESALSYVLWKNGLTPVVKNFLTIESPAEGLIGHHVPIGSLA